MNGPGALGAGLNLLEDYIRLYPREVAEQAEAGHSEEIIELLSQLPVAISAQLLNRFTPPDLARVLADMDLDLAEDLFSVADLARVSIALARVPDEKRSALLASAPVGVREELEDLMRYDLDSAGRLMDPYVACFRESATAQSALERIRASKLKRVHDVYVVDENGILTGAVPIQDLALAEHDTPMRELMHPPRGSVQAVEPKDEVVTLFEQKKLSSIPVVDHEGKLVGVIRYNTLISAAQEEALEGLQAMVGVSRDEKALSPAWFAVRKRLPWLQINLITAFLAAAVVGLFEDTIAKVTALAVLLPVVAGQSGNTGAQALAVAIRGLTIKEIRISQWIHLVRKELLAGFVNGCAVALVTAGGVWVWSRSWGLVMVIGCSMIVSMVIAGAAGAGIPMVLKAFKQDPAQSASIILTTVTDVVGFFSFLGIATVFMSLLPQG